MPLSWTDQPKFLEAAHRLCAFNANEGIIEVRKWVGHYYVSVGNLFGSQTVECSNPDTAFQIVHEAAKCLVEGGEIKVPCGCRLFSPDASCNTPTPNQDCHVEEEEDFY